MIKLLKMFAKGLLYVIGFPFFVLALIIFAVIGIFLFLYQFVKSVIDFFTGRTFFPELPEDRELRLKKEALENNNYQDSSLSQNVEDDIIMPFEEKEEIVEDSGVIKEPPMEDNTVEGACFVETPIEEAPIEETEIIDEEDPFSSLLMDEPLKREEAHDEIEIKEEREIKTTPYEVNNEEEELEEYIPEGASYSEDIDDDDTNNGVNIDFDL